jgi:hypothetical protein
LLPKWRFGPQALSIQRAREPKNHFYEAASVTLVTLAQGAASFAQGAASVKKVAVGA